MQRQVPRVQCTDVVCVLQVQVGEHRCTGVGPNKKLAKRSAAEAMLQLLGYSRPAPQPVKPAIKSADAQVRAHAQCAGVAQRRWVGRLTRGVERECCVARCVPLRVNG